jgi:hypothetical protein
MIKINGFKKEGAVQTTNFIRGLLEYRFCGNNRRVIKNGTFSLS